MSSINPQAGSPLNRPLGSESLDDIKQATEDSTHPQPTTIDAEKHLPPGQPLAKETVPPIAEDTRQMLHQTPDRRQVSTTESDNYEDCYLETPENPAKSIDQRAISYNESKPKGWLSILNPLNWWGGKTTSERKVTKPKESGFGNKQLFRLIRSLFVKPFADGVELDELTGALNTLSSVYHKSCHGTPFPPETIHLKSLTLTEQGIPLKDVTVKLHAVHATGEGEGAKHFTGLKVKAEITGTAFIKNNDETTQTAEISFPDVEINLGFEKGNLIEKLLTTGTVSSNFMSLAWNIFNLKTFLFPTKCNCQIKQAAVHMHVPGTEEARSTIKLNQAGLHFDRFPPPDEQGKIPAYHMKVTDLDAHLHGSRLRRIIPASLRETLSRLFPYAAMGETDIQVKTQNMDVKKQDDKTHLTCPEMQIESTGDFGLQNGIIQGLTIASQESSRTCNGHRLTVTDAPVQVTDTKTAISFRKLTGHLNIPQATLQLPHDIKGDVQVSNGVVSLSSTAADGYNNGERSVDFNIPEVQANLTGGITTCATVHGVDGVYNSVTESTDVNIATINADHFALGQTPDQVTEENCLIKGQQTLATNTHIKAAPDKKTADLRTHVSIDNIKAQNISGAAQAKEAELKKVSIGYLPSTMLCHQKTTPLPSSPGPKRTMGAEISIKADHIQASDIPVPKNITGENLQTDLTPTRVDGLEIFCTLGSALCTKEEQQNFGQGISRPVEAWQPPESKVVFADVDLRAKNLSTTAETKLTDPANNNLPPYMSSQIESSKPALTLSYDADQGLEYVKVSTAKTTASVDGGKANGKVSTQGLQAVLWNGTETSPEEIRTTVVMESMIGASLLPGGQVLPNSITATAGFTLKKPVIKTTVQSPEQDGTRPVKTVASVEKSDLQTNIKVSATEQTASAIAQEKLQTLASSLPPEQQEQLQPILNHLAAIQEEPEQTSEFTQQADLQTGPLLINLHQAPNGTTELQAIAQTAQAELPAGPVTGTVEVKDIEVKTTTDPNLSAASLQVDTITIPHAKTTPNSPLPVTFALQKTAVMHGIHASTTATGNNTVVHAEVDGGDIDLNLGIRGTTSDTPEPTDSGTDHQPGSLPVSRPLAPAHIQASFQQAEFDMQQEPDQTFTSTTVGQASVHMDHTKDQVGADIELNADISDALIATANHKQQDQVTKNLTVELESGNVKVTGELNATASVRQCGVSASAGPKGTYISPHFDSRNIEISFPDPVKELVQIFSQDAVQRSALGQVCDLEVTPELNENLTGTLTLGASGALAPLIGLAATYMASPVWRKVLGAASFLTRVLDFKLKLDHLPLKEGRSTFPDFMRCLSITISSKHSLPAKFYAGALNMVITLLQNRTLNTVMQKLKLLESSGDVVFTNLTDLIQENVQLQPASNMPTIQLPGTGDPLIDMRNMVQLGKSLPSVWNEKLYKKALYARLKHMNWHGQPIKKQLWASKEKRLELCDMVVRDFPLPHTVAGFRHLENMLNGIKAQLREDTTPTSLVNIYQRAQLLTNSPWSPNKVRRNTKPSAPSERVEAKIMSTTRFNNRYKQLNPALLAGSIDRAKIHLENSTSGSQHSPELIQRLLNHDAWNQIHTLTHKAQQQPLTDDELHQLWSISQKMNRKILKTVGPLENGKSPLQLTSYPDQPEN